MPTTPTANPACDLLQRLDMSRQGQVNDIATASPSFEHLEIPEYLEIPNWGQEVPNLVFNMPEYLEIPDWGQDVPNLVFNMSEDLDIPEWRQTN